MQVGSTRRMRSQLQCDAARNCRQISLVRLAVEKSTTCRIDILTVHALAHLLWLNEISRSACIRIRSMTADVAAGSEITTGTVHALNAANRTAAAVVELFPERQVPRLAPPRMR